MQAKLSASTIKSLQPKDKPFEVLDTLIKGFLLRVQPTGRKTFYYSYRNTAGKRQRIKIGVLSPELTIQQARDDALNYANQATKGIDVQEQKVSNKKATAALQEHTLSKFIDGDYKDWVLSHHKRGQETIDCINASFKDLLKLPLVEISHSVVEKWRMQRVAMGRRPTTINRQTNLLRGALSRAVEWEVIPDHPLKKLKNLKTDKSPKVRYLTDDERQCLFDVLEERDNELKQARERGNTHREKRGYKLFPSLMNQAYGDRMTPLILLSIYTGVRRGEAFDLCWSNVNLEEGYITISGDTAKSSNTRHIPLSPTVLAALKAWHSQQEEDDSDRVFPADDGGRLDNVRKSWATILKQSNITGFRWHDMRHDFASQLVMKGVPLNTVRELCGHASMDTTLRYAHLAPDHKTDAIALLG